MHSPSPHNSNSRSSLHVDGHLSYYEINMQRYRNNSNCKIIGEVHSYSVCKNTNIFTIIWRYIQDTVKDFKWLNHFICHNTTQKMKFSIKNFFSKCDQIRRKLWICSHLLKKSLILFMMGVSQRGPYQILPCHIYKRKNYPTKVSGFQF